MRDDYYTCEFYQHAETGEVFALQMDNATGLFVGVCGALPEDRWDTELLQNFFYSQDNLDYIEREDAKNNWLPFTKR